MMRPNIALRGGAFVFVESMQFQFAAAEPL